MVPVITSPAVISVASSQSSLASWGSAQGDGRVTAVPKTEELYHQAAVARLGARPTGRLPWG